MHKQTHKRAFYTLAGCIAALALCVAASLFLLTPAPKAQDVTIPGTRGDIYATVQLPGKLARGEELPLVVLCHGFTGSRSGDGHFAPLAADLAAQGIATVRLDFPGCGNSTEPFTAYTLSNMTDDVESAITYMQQTYGTGRTALVGHSMGGRLASLYPQRRGGITALALWSPANGAGLRGMEFLNIDDFSAVEALAAEAEASGSISTWGVDVSGTLFTEMRDSDPNAALRESALPMETAMDTIFEAADIAIENGYNIIILSDKGVDKDKAPIPALLVASGLHHHLIRKGTRMKVSIVLESGEPREVHHFACLVGYGVNGINPYMAYEAIKELSDEKLLEYSYEDGVKRFNKACTKGIVKIMSKMGISTIQSYQGAQIFEALGISESVVNKYFTGTTTRIGGMGIEHIQKEVLLRHAEAFDKVNGKKALKTGGDYKWRAKGEYHMFNPESIYKLQMACRTGNYKLYKEYAKEMDEHQQHQCTIRGMLDIKTIDKPIAIDQVESVESIVKRFKTGAMSYGSISQEAHECLAIAMNRLGGKSNSGEGGENPERYIPDENGDSRSSAIKQVASGRFGVHIHYLQNAKEIQIKMAQTG